MLCCASLLAAIGLDTNSTLLLLSAMLISPLMTPILGVGIFYFTHDIPNLRRAIQKIAMAVGISIVISLLYFLITPFGEITPEISARLKPTLLDALVAFIGGVTGIISITRKDPSTLLPGVAVAITILPPLCVVGYGISQLNWDIVIGSGYLFFINLVIISFVSSFIVRFLEFPVVKQISDRSRKIHRRVRVTSLIVILFPSTYWFTEAVSDKQNHGDLDQFIEQKVSSFAGVIDWRVEKTDSLSRVEVFTSGKAISEDSLSLLYQAFDSLALENTELKIIQPDISDVLNQVNKMVDSVQQKQDVFNQSLLEEVQLIFSEVEGIQQVGDHTSNVYAIEWVGWDVFTRNKRAKANRIRKFIELRTGKPALIKQL